MPLHIFPVYNAGLTNAFSYLCHKSNRSHFARVYSAINQLGMLEEHSNSDKIQIQTAPIESGPPVVRFDVCPVRASVGNRKKNTVT